MSTDNIVDFAPKREYVWEHRCSGAGQTFFLYRDGSVQCEACKEFVPNLCWGKRGEKEIPS